MASGGGIRSIENHATGDVFTQAMWSELEDNINNGIVTQLGASVYNSTAQNIPNATMTALTWDTEVSDTDTMHDNVTNPTRLTANTAGWYIAACNLILGAGGTTGTLMELELYVNGVAVVTENADSTGQSNDRLFLTYPVYLNVGDYVEFKAYQASTATRSTVGGAGNTQASIVRM